MKSPFQQKISGKWKQFKGKVKEKWGDLTDDELDQYEGNEDQLEGYLEEKTGKSRAAIRKELDRMANSI